MPTPSTPTPHPDTPEVTTTPTLSPADKAGAWLRSLGLGQGADVSVTFFPEGEPVGVEPPGPILMDYIATLRENPRTPLMILVGNREVDFTDARCEGLRESEDQTVQIGYNIYTGDNTQMQQWEQMASATPIRLSPDQMVPVIDRLGALGVAPQLRVVLIGEEDFALDLYLGPEERLTLEALTALSDIMRPQDPRPEQVRDELQGELGRLRAQLDAVLAGPLGEALLLIRKVGHAVNPDQGDDPTSVQERAMRVFASEMLVGARGRVADAKEEACKS